MSLIRGMYALAVKKGWVLPSFREEHGSDFQSILKTSLTEEQIEFLAKEILKGVSEDVWDDASPDSLYSGSPDEHSEELLTPTPDRFLNPELIARGGTGNVYKVYDSVLQRFVALKFLRTNNQQARKLILREARAQAKLNHPHVCRVYEVGEQTGEPYIAMHLIEGQTLHRARFDMTIQEKIMVISSVSEGLHAAHQIGLVHLDVKPANILIEWHKTNIPFPYITDFGLFIEKDRAVELEREQSWLPLGTPPYCSPEQLSHRWEEVDHRSDIYSLGVSLYVVLTNKSPFYAVDEESLHQSIRTGAWEPLRTHDPSIPRDLEAIVQRAMALRPEDRYSTCEAFSEDLQRFLKREPVTARPLGMVGNLVRWIDRNYKTSLALGGGLVIASSIGIWHLSEIVQFRRNESKAQVLGQKLKETESSLIFSRLTPPKNFTSQRKNIRKIIESLSTQIDTLDTSNRAPALVTLGKLYSLIGEPTQAAEAFDRAWNMGSRSPELAKARGELLGLKYLEHLWDQDSPTGEKNLFLWQMQEREPAIAMLKLAKSASSGNFSFGDEVLLQELQQGPQADFDQSILENPISEPEPWQYDSWILVMDLWDLRFQSMMTRGNYAEAERMLAQFRKILNRLIAIGRGDSRLWIRAGFLHFAEGWLKEERGGDPFTEREQALSSFNVALEIEPESNYIVKWVGEANRRMGVLAVSKSLDPFSYWDSAIRLLTTRYEDTKDEHSKLELGMTLARVLKSKGEYLMEIREDPDEVFRNGISILEHLKAQNSGIQFRLGYNWLLTIYLAQAKKKYESGKDVGSDLNKLNNLLDEARPYQPRNEALEFLTGVAQLRAHFLRSRGLDPRPSLLQALQEIHRQDSNYPNNLPLRLKKAELLLGLADADRTDSSEAKGYLKETLTLLTSIPATTAKHHELLSETFVQVAQRDSSDHRAISNARKHLRLAREFKVHDFDGWVIEGRLNLLEIRRIKDVHHPNRQSLVGSLLNCIQQLERQTPGSLEAAELRHQLSDL